MHFQVQHAARGLPHAVDDDFRRELHALREQLQQLHELQHHIEGPEVQQEHLRQQSLLVADLLAVLLVRVALDVQADIDGVHGAHEAVQLRLEKELVGVGRAFCDATATTIKTIFVLQRH